MGCNPCLVFCSVLLPATNPCYFLCLEFTSVHFLLATNPCYFLCLDTKKVTKENSRLQIILGLLFLSLPTQYNSSSCVLLKQYCLLKALPASLKTVALSQNSLRPLEIQNLIAGGDLHSMFFIRSVPGCLRTVDLRSSNQKLIRKNGWWASSPSEGPSVKKLPGRQF